MKHPMDELNDARKKDKALDVEHAKAKIDGYYKGSGGSVSRIIKKLARFLIWLLVLGVGAAIILAKYGNKIDEYFR